MTDIFRGGIPYAVDVNRLKEAYPVPTLVEGRVIEHEALGRVVNANPKTPRYYGVLNSWIAQMKNSNAIVIEWVPAHGVKVLNPAEILESAECRLKQKIGQTGKAIKRFAWVDRNRLDSTGQKRLDHQLQVGSKLKDALVTAKRATAIELAPVQSLPKRLLKPGDIDADKSSMRSRVLPKQDVGGSRACQEGR